MPSCRRLAHFSAAQRFHRTQGEANLLEMKGISKYFGAVRALHRADLSLAAGEIRALLGANGSGKSTMVKVLGGLIHRDAGSIHLDGREIPVRSSKESRSWGFGAAYQDLSLVPRLTVIDNIMLGHEPRRACLVDRNKALTTAMDCLDTLGVLIQPDSLVMDLDASAQSLVEIAKAISWKPRILLLDEVTASLHKEQVGKVFGLLRKLRDDGTAILFVSHRLDEVFELCDMASILRGGESVASVATSAVGENDLVFHMTGMHIEDVRGVQKTPQERRGETVLEARDFRVSHKVNGVSLKAAQGEIIGIGGLQGQGQEEFLRALYGYTAQDSGEMLVDGKPVRFKSPAEAVSRGFGFIPGDREREGIFHARPIIDNIYMAEFGKRGIAGYVYPKSLVAGAAGVVEKLKIKIGSPRDPASSLSGGNQQKLIIGRWIKGESRILLLDDPTKGVDVSSRREIHELLRGMAERGATIMLSSSDNEELLEISDRILVFYEGRIVVELSGDSIKEETLVAAMLGVTR
jgi:ribose transport system ATP-binding protein